MKIAVVSGKGGAGKTSIAVSLAIAAGNCTIVDCDVEEPNVHLLLKPIITDTKEAQLPVPRVDDTKCNYCKVCHEACQFNAIMVLPNSVLIFDKLCHGCGTCVYVCPQKALEEEPRRIGLIETGQAEEIHYIGGRLDIGEPMATPLIRQVKREIPQHGSFVIIDAPPGCTCPMVESIKDTDVVIIVAESSIFGYHDFLLVEEFIKELKKPYAVLENKKGTNRRTADSKTLREK